VTESLITAPATVEQAEAAWLDAQDGTDLDAIRRLMHPECLVVHSLPGRIDGVESFLQYKAQMGRLTGNTTHGVTVRRFGEVAIVTCVQEFRVAPAPDLIPLVVQAAVTRVWVPTDTGFRLVQLQMSRRQIPG
jgi:ketosteroid isomerase-like protein